MSDRRGIVTGGSWCVDDNKVVTHWPEEDGLAEILNVERHGGGSACSLAINLKRLDPGMPVETIAVVGDDDAGRFLVALADENGVHRKQMHVLKGTTPITDAYTSQRSGRRTHIYRLGVGKHLTPDHFDFEATRGKIFHGGLPGSHQFLDDAWKEDSNGWVSVFRKAQKNGLRTNIELASIDQNRNAKLVVPCLPHLDYVIVNDVEIGALADLPTLSNGTTDPAACERAARRILEMGSPELIVVHCPAFAIAVAREGSSVFRKSVAIPSRAIVGANGAGDAFAAGMLYAIHEEWSLHDALGLAHACAAASLRSIGSSSSVATWKENLAIAEQWGWRI